MRGFANSLDLNWAESSALNKSMSLMLMRRNLLNNRMRKTNKKRKRKKLNQQVSDLKWNVPKSQKRKNNERMMMNL